MMRKPMCLIPMVLTWAAFAADGVIVYQHEDFRGRYQVVNAEIPQLRHTQIGDDEVTSIRVPPGWRAVLFDGENFMGRAIEIRGDVADLGATRFGSDRLSSIRVFNDVPIQQEKPPAVRRPPRRSPPPPRVPPRRPPAVEAPAEGVTLFSETGYRGAAETFLDDRPRMRATALGNDRVRSVFSPPGWRVILYEHDHFEGRAIELGGPAPDLSRTPIGLDAVSSIRVIDMRAYGPVEGAGVTLYRHSGFRGDNIALAENAPQLRGTPLGNDEASSVRVSPGFVATLYEHDDYRGRAIEVRGEIADLRDTTLGNDSVSSVAVRWDPEAAPLNRGRLNRRDQGFDWDRDRDDRDPDVVLLYNKTGYEGDGLAIRENIANLRYSAIGNDAVCSLRIPRGYEVVLYEHADFEGRSVVLRADVPDLNRTPLGVRQASSIEVRRLR